MGPQIIIELVILGNGNAYENWLWPRTTKPSKDRYRLSLPSADPAV